MNAGGLPDAFFSASLGLFVVGLVLGILYASGILTILALDLAFFGGLALFVPWAVLKLDPGRLTEAGDDQE